MKKFYLITTLFLISSVPAISQDQYSPKTEQYNAVTLASQLTRHSAKLAADSGLLMRSEASHRDFYLALDRSVSVALLNKSPELLRALVHYSAELAAQDPSGKAADHLVQLWLQREVAMRQALEGLNPTKRKALVQQLKVRLKEHKEGNG